MGECLFENVFFSWLLRKWLFKLEKKGSGFVFNVLVFEEFRWILLFDCYLSDFNLGMFVLKVFLYLFFEIEVFVGFLLSLLLVRLGVVKGVWSFEVKFLYVNFWVFLKVIVLFIFV